MYISNIVINGNICGGVNKKIFKKYYFNHKKKFKSIKFRFNKHPGVFYLFSNGAFVGLGHKNCDWLRETGVPAFYMRLIELDFIETFPKYQYRIVNMVGCDKLPAKIDLHKFLTEQLEKTKGERVKKFPYHFKTLYPYYFNPEFFPAAYLYINNCVIKLFASGKYNIIGAKSKRQLAQTQRIFLNSWIRDYQNK